MKFLKDIILEKLVINRYTKDKNPLSILDVQIESIEHFKDILTKFFGNKVIKSGPISKKEVLFKGKDGPGQYVGDHFKIDLGDGYDNDKVTKYIYVGKKGIKNNQLVILQKNKGYKGVSACRLNGRYNEDELKIGDNFKEWLLAMKDRYDNKGLNHDINLLITFGLLK